MKVLFATASMRHDGELQSTSERLINLFPETKPADYPILIRSCLGYTSVGTVGLFPRAMVRAGSNVFIAANGSLYMWNGTSVSTVGRIPDDVETTMAWNGTYVGVVASGRYFVSDGTTIREIKAGAFTSYGSIGFISGYFVLTESGGGRHQVTNLNNPLVISGADFSTADYLVDDVKRVMIAGLNVWFFGAETTEVWQNIGGSNYPLARIPGAVIERGILAPQMAIKMDDAVYWIGDDFTVNRARGLAAEVVSTPAVSNAIKERFDAGDEIAVFRYVHDAHKNFVIWFGGRPAFVFDEQTGSYHERSSGIEGPWAVRASAFDGSDWLFADENGVLGKMGGYQEAGAPLRRVAQSRNISNGGSRFVIPNYDVEVSRGSAVRVGAQFSPDEGRTWKREIFRDLPAGDYKRRVTYRSLGQYKDFASRVMCAANADFSIHEADIG